MAVDLTVRIRGHNPPGRVFCDVDGSPLPNVHVGPQVRSEPSDLVPGDEPTPVWELRIGFEEVDDGGPEFRGAAVHGRKGDRFLYLTWGDLGDDGSFAMFRRAKLVLNRIDPALVRSAVAESTVLTASVDLTARDGGPVCARVDPPALMWGVEPA